MAAAAELAIYLPSFREWRFIFFSWVFNSFQFLARTRDLILWSAECLLWYHHPLSDSPQSRRAKNTVKQESKKEVLETWRWKLFLKGLQPS